MLKEDPKTGVFVSNLSTKIVTSFEELHKLVARGARLRATAQTAMNAVSSRSHALLQLKLDRIDRDKMTKSKLNLVDLAGSEKVAETQVEGERLKEAMKINLSLSALCNVISALVDKKKAKHIPYRDSVLTRLL